MEYMIDDIKVILRYERPGVTHVIIEPPGGRPITEEEGKKITKLIEEKTPVVREVSDKCRDVAESLFYLYGISKALYYGWKDLPPERRNESIDNISRRLKKLEEEGIVGSDDARILETNIKELKESSYPPLLAGLLKDNLLDASINSIADCECPRRK